MGTKYLNLDSVGIVRDKEMEELTIACLKEEAGLIVGHVNMTFIKENGRRRIPALIPEKSRVFLITRNSPSLVQCTAKNVLEKTNQDTQHILIEAKTENHCTILIISPINGKTFDQVL